MIRNIYRAVVVGLGGIVVTLLLASCDRPTPDERLADGHSEFSMDATDNLSPNETSQQWITLFDGESLTGWTDAQGNPVGESWTAIDGELTLLAGGGGDILTAQAYGDFELSLEWKISEGGNSGVIYRVLRDGRAVWMSGVEYQVLDDASFPQLAGTAEVAGSAFALYGAQSSVTRPAGTYNDALIRVKDGHVQHWLNGTLVAEFTLWSADWQARFAASKFAVYNQFARAEVGYIALQDHGNRVWYRNIKLRAL